jgi:hypothetical protein
MKGQTRRKRALCLLELIIMIMMAVARSVRVKYLPEPFLVS